MQRVARWERPNVYICLIHFMKSDKSFTLAVNLSQPSSISQEWKMSLGPPSLTFRV
ncbi:hypothetical protein Syun_009276 [Stephania yunnanensis]|uniref:Uncharacterized protein n=1 Tax=Stephania yunnanensis TaxID=152371 RepID=A0AAP0PNW5_9MAGN